MITDEPEVLTWMIACAPRAQSSPAGHHWWRELVVTGWRDAHDQWLKHRELACSGWATEEADFQAHTPRPTLKAFMVGLSQGSLIPEFALEVSRRD